MISEVWGPQLCRRNPPRAAARQHRDEEEEEEEEQKKVEGEGKRMRTRRLNTEGSSKTLPDNQVNNNEPLSEHTHTHTHISH